MIKVDIKIDNSQFNAKIAKQQKALTDLPKQALDEFKSLTPIKSGNARANTDLTTNNRNIVGHYPYAQRLDNGWSKQAPKGMITPFTRWWVDQLKKISRIK